MGNKDKAEREKMLQEGDFPFPLEKFKKMLELMRNGCSGDGDMADCCSMMRKMTRYGEGEESMMKKKKEV
jgi:hypothetical protein